MGHHNIKLSHVAWGVLFLCAAASAQDYKIKMTRPVKVGGEYILTNSVTFDRSVDVVINNQNQPAKKDGFTGELHGVIKVLAINEKAGTPTKLTCKVDKLTRDGTEMYSAGTVITAEKVNHQTVFTIDGDKVDENNAEVLDTLIDVEDPTRSINDDGLIGTDQPQKVGGSWPINAENTAKDFSEHGMPIDAKAIKGDSKLVEIKKQDAIEMMVVQSTMSADLLSTKLPDGTKTSGGNMSGTVKYVLPTDGSSTPVQDDVDVKIVVNINLPGGMGKATISTHRTGSEKLEAVKE